jgi:hypothetical protein
MSCVEMFHPAFKFAGAVLSCLCGAWRSCVEIYHPAS